MIPNLSVTRPESGKLPAGEETIPARLKSGVVFVTPAPRMLQAGAVWVTINNWLEACRRRWGETVVVTPDGVLTEEEVRRTAWGGGPGVGPSRRGLPHLPRELEAMAKDARSLVRMARFHRSVRSLSPAMAPLFVWQHHDLFQLAGFDLARRYRCPLVLFVDAPQVWESRKWGIRRPGWGSLVERWGESWQFRRADLVACVSDAVAEAVIARGAAPERVIVTPCTADAIRSAVPGRDRRREWGLDDEVVVGWVGSFRPFHQAEGIVRAVATLQTKQPPVLLMVGEGPTRSRCEALAQRLGVRRALFPGAVPHAEIPDYLRAIDVAVIPGGSGPGFHYSPLKLKEYLAAGRATVAPRVGEMLRMLDNGSDALLYDAGDEEGMATAIRALVEDPDLRTGVGSRGRATYDRLFTMDRQLDLVSERLRLPPGNQAPALAPGALDPAGAGHGPLSPAGNGD